MNYLFSASRLMKAKDVVKQSQSMKDNAAIIVAIETKVKNQFSQRNEA